MSPVTRGHEAARIAAELLGQDPDWVTFFREVLGVDGVLRRLFTTPEALEQFQQSDEYARIQAMVVKLRERNWRCNDVHEPTRVITIRLPKSLHESLRTEAHERQTSMNQLCISRLLQVIEIEASL